MGWVRAGGRGVVGVDEAGEWGVRSGTSCKPGELEEGSGWGDLGKRGDKTNTTGEEVEFEKDEEGETDAGVELGGIDSIIGAVSLGGAQEDREIELWSIDNHGEKEIVWGEDAKTELLELTILKWKTDSSKMTWRAIYILIKTMIPFVMRRVT